MRFETSHVCQQSDESDGFGQFSIMGAFCRKALKWYITYYYFSFSNEGGCLKSVVEWELWATVRLIIQNVYYKINFIQFILTMKFLKI